jgi:hypothetical protein
MKQIFARLLVGLCLLSMLNGCGYSSSTLLREDVRSVAIPVFNNKTWRHGLEVELTQEVVEEIKRRTSLRIASAGSAETILRGALVGYEEDVVTKSEEDVILLKRVAVEVQFQWVDARTGRALAKKSTLTEVRTLSTARSEQLVSSIFRDVAESMVEKMERDW